MLVVRNQWSTLSSPAFPCWPSLGWETRSTTSSWPTCWPWDLWWFQGFKEKAFCRLAYSSATFYASSFKNIHFLFRSTSHNWALRSQNWPQAKLLSSRKSNKMEASEPQSYSEQNWAVIFLAAHCEKLLHAHCLVPPRRVQPLALTAVFNFVTF